MNFTKSTVAVLGAFVLLLSACTHAPVKAPEPKVAPVVAVPAPAPVSPAAPTTTRPTTPIDSGNVSVKPANQLPMHLDPASAISQKRSIYFDFDDFSIKSEFGQVIERHGKYLAANPKLSIKVEGNADERGGREYNLALGQKRADAVVRALKVYGVQASQMEAISWGKEKPKASGHDEASHAENRRVDLFYPTK